MPIIVPLSKEHDRPHFDCGVPALKTFLKAAARQHGTKGISRTFVLVEPDAAAEILGFFTLTLCEVRAGNLPTAYAKKYPEHGLPAVRLARLAVSLEHRGEGHGEWLLAEAVHRTVEISNHAGLVGLFVDAKDDSERNFYVKYGFVALPGVPMTLFLPLATLRAADRPAPRQSGL